MLFRWLDNIFTVVNQIVYFIVQTIYSIQDNQYFDINNVKKNYTNQVIFKLF